MSKPEDIDDSSLSPSAAEEALETVDVAARRIRVRRAWYIAGALVMAAALAVVNIVLASWPERLADVIVPGLLVVVAILAAFAWFGRGVLAAGAVSTNRAVYLSAVLMVVTFLLNRLLIPEGFSGWVVLTGLLPALPFIALAWRAGRA